MVQRIIRPIILLSILATGLTTNGQFQSDVPQMDRDSLIALIPQFSGTALVDHMNLVATSISQRYPDSCLSYAYKALDLARSMDYESGKAVAHFNIANAFFYIFDVKNSLVNYMEAVKVFEELTDEMPPAELGHTYMHIAAIIRFGTNYIVAAKYYLKAISVYGDLKMYKEMRDARNLLSYNYLHARMFDSAFYYQELNLVDFRKIDLTDSIENRYLNYGFIFLWTAKTKPDKTIGSLAIPYLDTGLVYANRLKRPKQQIDAMKGLGECYHHYMDPPDYLLAEKYYKLALGPASKINDWISLADIYTKVGDLYIDMDNPKLSKLYLDSGLMAHYNVVMSRDTKVSPLSYKKYLEANLTTYFRSSLYKTYYRLFRTFGEYDSAFHYLHLSERDQDSLQQRETRNQVDYLLAEAENESIQNKMQLLEQQKELEKGKAERSRLIILGLGLLLVIALLVAYLLIRQNRLQAKQEKMGLQQKLFRTQMNPHFIFNSLSSIQHLVVSEEADKASIFLARFSTLVRSVLYSSNKDAVPIEDEIKSIESYLSLQKIRYDSKIEYKIEVGPELDTESLTIPPLLAQPFIENAIEHGIKHKEGQGNIAIRIGLYDGSVLLEVEDDGVGRRKSHELEKGMRMDHVSMATEITRERLKILNRKVREKIRFDITDLADDKGAPIGTKVSIVLPVMVG